MSSLRVDRPGRIELLDAWRGAAVLAMIGWHLCWDLAAAGLLPPERMTGPAASAARALIACSFVVLAGISCRFSRSNLRRGLRVLGCALLVTGVSALAGTPVWFGILHLLGLCMLGWAAFGKRLEKLPETAAAAVYLALFLFFYVLCARVRVDVPWLWPLGFRTESFRSADYYPLLPWSLLFLAGTAAGGRIRRDDGAWKERSAWPPLVWIGQRALWIYLLHQPVLLGALALFTGRLR